MKNLIRLTVITCLSVFLPLHAADTFEGKIHLQVKNNKSVNEIDYAIKQDLLRIEAQTSRGPVPVIMNMAKKEMIVMMPDQKMYMTMPIKTVTDAVQKASTDNSGKLEKTGKAEKILGYSCEQYIYKDDRQKGTTELWLASGLGTFQGLGNAFGPRGGNRTAQPAWQKELMDKGAFPLRVITHNEAGAEEFRMEATSVEKTSLPASLFEPPAGYTKFSMPSIPGITGPGTN
ncbi:MAG TPA: DUF4412 domain-containing protein [Opitutaceae bacterium]|nr:DUF4412 domain-containing protein [Opitutaceae bacterium]